MTWAREVPVPGLSLPAALVILDGWGLRAEADG
jgi:hypothetical protein